MNIRKASVEASTDANARNEGEDEDEHTTGDCDSLLSFLFNCPFPSPLDSPASYAPRSCSCTNSMFSKDCSRMKSEIKASKDLPPCARTIFAQL